MKQTVRGLLLPDKWDQEGRVVGLALLTDSEEKFILQPEMEIEPLLASQRLFITVRGRLQTSTDQHILYVEDYYL